MHKKERDDAYLEYALTFLESVLEASRNGLQISAASSSGGLSSLALLTPLILSGLCAGESAGSAGALLLVERDLSATAAASVGLGVTLTETLGTLGL